jgi:thiol-disulfide isomerase/thioredoxin
LAGLQPIPAGDFILPTLDGRKVRLSDFRGQAVLINFWTTWCTACLAEIPALIELQKRHGEKLVILGVSLDYVPDSHGHIGGHGSGLSDRADDGHETMRVMIMRITTRPR